MKRATRNSVVTVSAFMLASCTPPEIQISITRVNDLNVVTLTQDWGLIFSDKKPPCLDQIEVRRISSGEKRGAEVWRVEAKTQTCVDVGRFVLGSIPSGFREVTPMTAEPHGSFELAVWGVGSGWKKFALH
jgi:hypothetical protein